MSGIIKLKPNFNAIRNAVTFPVRELNYILASNLLDNYIKLIIYLEENMKYAVLLALLGSASTI